MINLKIKTIAIGFIISAVSAAVAAPTPDPTDSATLKDRSDKAASALVELIRAPDKAVPTSLLKNATCIAVLPEVVKGGFIVAITHGKGLVSCREARGWSAPAFLSLSGGSFGLQAGVDSADLVLVFMRSTALDTVSRGSFTLGADASVAAGPVGRDLQAGVDYKLDSDVYSYSRTKGLFAGIAITGSAITPDKDANSFLYTGMTAKNILVMPGHQAPAETVNFIDILTANAP
jgi:lipid-binding SYLF domain-containing protein